MVRKGEQGEPTQHYTREGGVSLKDVAASSSYIPPCNVAVVQVQEPGIKGTREKPCWISRRKVVITNRSNLVYTCCKVVGTARVLLLSKPYPNSSMERVWLVRRSATSTVMVNASGGPLELYMFQFWRSTPMIQLDRLTVPAPSPTKQEKRTRKQWCYDVSQ